MSRPHLSGSRSNSTKAKDAVELVRAAVQSLGAATPTAEQFRKGKFGHCGAVPSLLRMLHDLVLLSPSCTRKPVEHELMPLDPAATEAVLSRSWQALHAHSQRQTGADDAGGHSAALELCRSQLAGAGYSGPSLDTSDSQPLLLASAWLLAADKVFQRWSASQTIGQGTVSVSPRNQGPVTCVSLIDCEDSARTIPYARWAERKAHGFAAAVGEPAEGKGKGKGTHAAAFVSARARGHGISSSSRGGSGGRGGYGSVQGDISNYLKKLTCLIGKTRLKLRALLAAQQERTKRLHRASQPTPHPNPFSRHLSICLFY